MSTAQESKAMAAWVASFAPTRKVEDMRDLCDGQALFQVLGTIDGQAFQNPISSETLAADTWVHRFNRLKRLYKLLTHYYVEILQANTSTLDVPNLQAIAKDYDEDECLKLCRIALCLAVQSDKKEVPIQKIQSLEEMDQHALMRAIEQVMLRVSASNEAREPSAEGMIEDDEYYQAQYDRSRMVVEKETLEGVYQQLLEEHRKLQTSFDDITAERDDALSQVTSLRRDVEAGRNDKSDSMLRAEVDKLRSDLQKSEDSLGLAEQDLERQGRKIEELQRKADDARRLTEENTKLHDRVDELKHAADQYKKSGNVAEKYKKKLEEAADVRRQLKELEEQNAELVDRNASLEDEYRKVSAFKPLMESYKNQIAELETKCSNLTRDSNTLRYELDQTREKLRVAEEERTKEAEAVELYEERVKELELGGPAAVMAKRKPKRDEAEYGVDDGATEMDEEDEDEDEDSADIGGEIDDALHGTTMTDLKIKVRKLTRELEAAKANKADASRILVLENLLEDANRMKSRYETDWLKEHQEKLKIQSELETIRAGKSNFADGPEAAFALRKRLNETVDEVDRLKRDLADLQNKHERTANELTVAKSDLTLVNKDQLEILQSLRESVSAEKADLERDVQRLRSENRVLEDKNRMQLDQVNKLLMEKIDLQSEGLTQREKMLARERDMGQLRASLAGKAIPEEARSLIAALQEERAQLQDENRVQQQKLEKAKEMLKEAQTNNVASSSGAFEEAERSFKAQIAQLKEELDRRKRTYREGESRHRLEQQLVMSAWYDLGLRNMQMAAGGQHQRGAAAAPNSWLAQQRKNMGSSLNFPR